MADRSVKRPLFSICIPNFNYGRFIGETIESVLGQSFRDFEIVVADNASTDDSVERIEKFRSRKIRLIRNRYNIGFAPNLQRVTMEAKGHFVNLLSSDDQMRPGALETYAEVIESSGADRDALVLASDAEGFDNDGRTLRIIRKAPGSFARVSVPPDAPAEGGALFDVFEGRAVLRDRLLELDTFGVFCTIAYSRALWEQVEGYNAVRTIGPDKHFAYKLLFLDPAVAYVHRPLYRYRDYISDNRAAVQTTIRPPIDDYLNVLEFGTEAFLEALGLRREDLVDAFLRRVLHDGLVQGGLGNDKLARRLFAFAMATFPKEALHHANAYGLASLVATGPLARAIGPPLRNSYIRRRDSRQERR